MLVWCGMELERGRVVGLIQEYCDALRPGKAGG
jgi:hypothetical protein